MNKLRTVSFRVLVGVITSLLTVNATASERIKVACVGDSITFGAGIQDRDKNSYPAQLGNLLGAGWDVKNFGVNGHTLLSNGNAPYINSGQYKAALAFQPDVVIIKLGTNDSKPDNWKLKEAFVGDYLQLIDQFRQLDSQPVIWICKPVPVFPEQWGISDQVVREEVNLRVELVARKAGVPVIDLHTPFRRDAALFPDKVHPNAAGAEKMASIISAKLLAYGTNAPALRTTLSLDRGWKFKKGWFDLPGRVRVDGWRYQFDERGESAAKEMTVGGLDTSKWSAGDRFNIRQGQDDPALKGWLAVGDMNQQDSFIPVWFRTELPGKPALHPALEFSRMHRIGHVYVNGVKLARHEGEAEELSLDLRSVWKSEGVNTIAVLIEGLRGSGKVGNVKFVDLAKVVIPEGTGLHPDFDDSDWRTVDAPHDYMVEQSIDRKHGADGYQRIPALYRKTITKPQTAPGDRVWLEFDGVYRMSHYWLNGKPIDVHAGGFVLNRIDITDELKPGENSLIVKVNPTISESGYDGAGIYRHVRMVVVPKVHVAPDGIFVSSSIADPKDGVIAPAVVNVAATFNNSGKTPLKAEVMYEVVDAAGCVVQTETTQQTLAPGETALKQSLNVAAAKLWSCERPELYALYTTIHADGQPIDRVRTSFGIRKIEFDAQRGFFLNGKNVKLKGICSRPNHAGVGHAMPARLTEWRLEQLKKMGGNAYRCAHYPFGPDFYDACDRLGVLVMDEFRSFGDGSNMISSDKTTADTLTHQTIQLMSHRNHPSIIIWCIGNEGGSYQNKPSGARIARSIKKLVDVLDGTRPSTYANNGSLGPGLTVEDRWTKKGVSGALDVVGVNYNCPRYDLIRQRYTDMPIIGTEVCSEIGTRGCYDRTQFTNKMGGPDLYGDQKANHLSAYSESLMGWSATCEEGWKTVSSRDWMAGYFVWSGFDYQGEPTPFVYAEDKAISTQFGIMDFCGFPKDAYWYYKAWWGAEPVLHVFPHWNWAGKEGQKIPVWVHSNCDEVELFLNGQSLGKKKVESKTHLEWDVSYTAGKLEAKGSFNGKEMHTIIETTGAPAGITLAPDRVELAADGADLAWVGVSVVDAQGRVVPTAGNLVNFSVRGPGKILGVGNGDPACHEDVKASKRSAFNGLCMVLVQTKDDAGEIVLTAESAGLAPVSVTLQSLFANRRLQHYDKY